MTLTEKSQQFFQKHGVPSEAVTTPGTGNQFDEYGLYSILDLSSGLYDSPYLAKNHVTACRRFESMLKSGSDIVKSHPEDYHLMFIGTMNMSTGIVNSSGSILISRAVDYIKAPDMTLPPVANQ